MYNVKTEIKDIWGEEYKLKSKKKLWNPLKNRKECFESFVE